jgi:GntR family histidine utilization transcriptional repressor|tara:strand:+ start:6387 stop:7139 length:753 start_codon:yes stop_codon:yes gene_type:complete
MSAKSMKMTLSGDTSLPLYQQIKSAITEKIRGGEWQPGQMIPSENQLAEELGASRMTINRPLRELSAEGLLRRVHGVGTFVAEPPRQAHLIELRSIADEIRQYGKTHRSKLLSLRKVRAGKEIGQRMEVKAGATVFRVIMIHYQDDVPIQLESRHVNPDLVPEFLQVDFTSITPTDYLISQLRPEELEHIVQAIMPDDFLATQLSIPLTEPCLKLRRRTWKGGRIVTSVDLVYPSSRYELGARYLPSKSL